MLAAIDADPSVARAGPASLALGLAASTDVELEAALAGQPQALEDEPIRP